MSKAEDFLEDARKSFGLAANSTRAGAVEHYAEMGRDYLRLSREAGQLVHIGAKACSELVELPK